MREHHRAEINSGAGFDHFHNRMFHGFDFDNTMLRIGSMHEHAAARRREPRHPLPRLSPRPTPATPTPTLGPGQPALLRQSRLRVHGQRPAGDRQNQEDRAAVRRPVLRLLKPGGRAAVIVPDGVLFGSTRAHKELRRMLVDDHKLDAVVKLPSGVFKPYAGVSTAILFFTKTNSGGTDHVWFYDVASDGFSLDDKRQPSTRPIFLTSSSAGPTATASSETAPAPSRASPCPARRSPTTTTTSPSIATRRSSTKKSNTAPRRRRP